MLKTPIPTSSQHIDGASKKGEMGNGPDVLQLKNISMLMNFVKC